VVDTPVKEVLAESVPHVDAGHTTGGVPCVVLQVTPALAGSLRIVGVNGWVMVTGRMAETGETSTMIAKTVTVSRPDCVESDLEAAVMVTNKFAAGGVDGAV
jgi:hypothetical protein